jgi:penicillin-binding protein 1A
MLDFYYVRILHIFLASFFLLLISCIGALFCIAHNQWIDFAALEQHNPAKPTILLDDAGQEWARFQYDRRDPIQFEDMPEHLINAFIAAEDWNFFNHLGLSWKGILRSICVNLYHGRKVQGASTITQQLVKLLFFDGRKTFSRKIKEQLYALLIERHYTKKQILEAYLNRVYFGCGIYGVEAASQRFWGKKAKDIALDEAATLAAVVCSPSRYCPLLCPLSAEKRRNTILKKMQMLQFIDEDTCEQLSAQSLMLQKYERNDIALHFKEMIRIFLEDLVGKQAVYNGGFVVQTTINMHIQEVAEQVFKKQCLTLRDTLGATIDGALITLERASGQIKALIGGVDFFASKFNRALQARRQIGSVFKPLVYAAALQAGSLLTDTEIDEPFELVQNNMVWRPNNWDLKFHGPITLAYALSRSNNIVSIKTLLKIGAQPVIDLAKKSHLEGPFHSYPSLALGCIDATLKEVVGMFNIFANDGKYVEPHYIVWVKNQWGTKIFKQHVLQEQVLNSCISGKIAKVLELGLERIRKIFPHEKWLESQAISKTGTTNDSRTCWFVGSTPQDTTGIWFGFDDNRPMGKKGRPIYPIHTAFPPWLALHASLKSHPSQFSYDSSLRELVINERNGNLMADVRLPGAISIFV